MPKVDFPEGPSPFFNPAAYTNVHSELKKTKEKGKLSHTRSFETALDEAKSEETSEIEKLATTPSEDALRELLDNVHESGEELKARPFPEEIKKYKVAVRSFLHYVVENGYTVEERMSGTNILKRKKFTLIQVVDRKLEQLAAGILAGQSSQLNILARIDEITGLLIDLTR